MSKLRNGVVVAALLAAMGCSNNDTNSHPEDTGSVQFALVVVPTDVQCIHVAATGTRVKEQDFPVAPGQMSLLSMIGLPVGAVTFTGEAFNGPCGGPASMMPTYVADPVTAQINATGVTALTLNMRRNGQASISVDFETGNMCVPAGSPCSPTNPNACCTGLTCQGDATGNPICQMGSCPPVGSLCDPTRPDACCTGLVCQADATGNATCQQQNMCVQQGGQCLPGTACCAGLSCVADPTGIQSCQPNICVPPGGICGPGVTQQCCSGLTCALDPATGSPRCQQPGPTCSMVLMPCSPAMPCCAGLSCTPSGTSFMCQPNACGQPGSLCGPGSTTPCCSGLMCQPDPTGVPTCQQACVPGGAQCGGATPCCAGLMCTPAPDGTVRCQ
jgi:hypothetical protein